jgi:ubiquinone/menaquinone biosynthesis C-methylase UbiE
MKWFRDPSRPHHVALSMIGAKPGDRVLVATAGDGTLAAQLGLVTGLNGRTLVVDTDAISGEKAASAAADAGALVDFAVTPVGTIPESEASFDIVVFNHTLGPLPEWDRSRTCAEALRVLRPAGRLVALEHTRRPGLFGLVSHVTAPAASGADVVDLAQRVGFKAVRILGDTEGLVFIEATRARTS